MNLKRKHAILKVAEKEGVALSNLHEILLRIETAKLDAEVLQAYETGSATLRSLIGNVERADRAVSELQETLEEAKEIEDRVATVYSCLGVPEEDVAQLEDQLDRLEAELHPAPMSSPVSVPTGHTASPSTASPQLSTSTTEPATINPPRLIME